MAEKIKQRISIFIAALMMLASNATASADPRVEESVILVNNLVAHLQDFVGTNPNPEQIRSETDMIIDRYFDYNLVARFAAGQAWRSATAAERTDYKIAFRRVLLALAETQFQYFNRVEYTHKSAMTKGNKLVVATGMVHDKTGIHSDALISWRISTKPSKPARIIDLEIENISMLITQQQENTAIIRQNGGSFRALIDALNKQADDIAASQSISTD